MTTRYQNELNSFRSGIEARTALHKDRVDAVNQALGVKAGKVFENAKKIGDAGTKLIESGIGVSALAPTLAKYTRKGINKFNQVRSQTQEAIDKVKGKAQSLVKDGEAGVKKVANQATEGVEDAQQALNKSGGDVANGNQSLDDVAGRMKSQVMDAQKARDSTISEDVDGGANQSVGGDAAQAKGGQNQAMDDFDAGKSFSILRENFEVIAVLLTSHTISALVWILVSILCVLSKSPNFVIRSYLSLLVIAPKLLSLPSVVISFLIFINIVVLICITV